MRPLLVCVVLAIAACGTVQSPDPCGSDPCDSNATCAQAGTSDSHTCTCNPGYTGDGETCAAVSCGALPEPANGGVSTSNTMVGGMATYSCDPLFRPQGEVNRTCQADGTWSGAAPMCIACQASQRVIVASQTDSVQYNGDVGTYSYRDNMTRAYSNPTGNCGGLDPPCDITGWMGFDLTPIPDGALIQAMSVHAFATTVAMGPLVRLQYSTANNWTRASTAPAALVRTVAEVSAPVALTAANQGTFVSIPVTLGAANWSVDLADNWLTLGIDNPLTAYTYAYFAGSDLGMPDNRPYLQITYCN